MLEIHGPRQMDFLQARHFPEVGLRSGGSIAEAVPNRFGRRMRVIGEGATTVLAVLSARRVSDYITRGHIGHSYLEMCVPWHQDILLLVCPLNHDTDETS